MVARRSASTTDAPSDHDVAYQLGQISGQLRELVHIIVNLQATVNAIGLRVAALEASENRREGATGMVQSFLKSPAIGWLVGAAISAWAILTGKVHF